MKVHRSLLLALVTCVVASPSYAYGPEGLFGGRPQPDSSIVLGNPVELKNDRPQRAETVVDHPRPDYDPAPIDVGSLELFPSMEVGQAYDSNIYATKDGVKDDSISTVRPIVTVFSNWNRHAFSMTTFGDINFYANHDGENFNNFVTDLTGRYDIVRQTFVTLRGGYQHLAEPRYSPDAVNGSEPSTFNLTKAGVGFYRGVGVVKVGVDYDMNRFEYNTIPSSRGPLEQSTRDRYVHMLGGKASYDVSENVKPYVKVGYNAHTYDNNKAHDSNGYDAVAGSTFDFGGITSLDVYAGFMGQYFDDFGVKKSYFAPKFGGRLDWNVTGKTSAILEVSRTLEDTSSLDFNSYVSTGGSATVTHELRRNILVETGVSVTRNDYNGFFERQDDDLSAYVGGRYMLNRHIYTDLNYTWTKRFSDTDTAKYQRNLVLARMGYRL